MKSQIEIYTMQKVKERRLQLEISQRYLADYLNIHHSYVSLVEDMDSDAAYNLDHLNEIAIVLECSVKDFIPDKPYRNNKKKQ